MRPELIIFDCDGVLIDSEMIASRLVARNLTALGWEMRTEEAMGHFLGMSIMDMVPIVEARLARRLPAGWREGLAAELVTALGQEVTLIPGARETLERVSALGFDWRIASNSSQAEMAVKFARTGLSALVAGRTHSGTDRSAIRPKPAPDVYLEAAAAAGVSPAQCIVLEDSRLGILGGVAAGMLCYGFAPHGNQAALEEAGARRIVKGLAEFVALLEGGVV